jgi:hypothetical protein
MQIAANYYMSRYKHYTWAEIPENLSNQFQIYVSVSIFHAVIYLFQKIKFERKGVKIYGKRLSHLRFADDVVIASETAEKSENMLKELNVESKKNGLKMHMGETKAMFNTFAEVKDIVIENQVIENVNEHVYLDVLTKLEIGLDEGICRKITLVWKAFWKQKDILKSRELPLSLKRKIFNQCVLPAMTCGFETWTSTKKLSQKLLVVQRAMERYQC